MANRVKMTEELRQQIRDVYEETLGVRETGRRLDVHENTVRQVLKAAKGLCSDCATPINLGKRYCPACTDRRNAWDKARTATRRRQGLCVECDEVVQLPSHKYCAKHRLDNIDRNTKSRLTVNQKRLAPGSGVPLTWQREKQLRYDYGQAGVAAWHRDKACCTMCGVSYTETAIHVHHLDADPTHNVEDNLTCLCYRCHKVAHHFLDFSSQRTLDWLRTYYPHLSLT